MWDSKDLPPAIELQERDESTPVLSIFDSNYLLNLGKRLVEDRNPLQHVPNWFRGCRLQSTTGNARGVPYKFQIGHTLR